MKFLGLLIALAITPTPAVAAPAHHNGCTATTSLGRLSGQAGELCVYRGIPYAAPPTGDRRFQPPQPVQPWQGTFSASDSSKVCPQFRDNQSEEYPDEKAIYTDEDCLRLNIWAPRTRGKHPVIVFSHGGAARFGTANETRYDGSILAKTGDAVVVTLNYRLGLLGWAGGSNNGVRDQMAALDWVRHHIADFGGDPANVTAVGESEGAFSLSATLATDNPQRLFRRVVLQSGSGYLLQARPKGPAPSELAGMSTLDILRLQENLVGADPVAGAVYFGPYIDGRLIRQPVIDAVRAGNARGIEVLIGTNRDELRYFAQFDPSVLHMTQEQYRAFFPKELDMNRTTETYQANRPGQSESDIVLAMFTDQAMRVPATRLAEEQSRWARSYVYQFDWTPAVHTAELPFVFGTLRFTGIPGGAEAAQANPTATKALAKEMTQAWTAFARHGDPGWPRSRETNRITKTWDTPTRLTLAPSDAERSAWDNYDFRVLNPNLL
jgi:para-nitrobenzyl esterase